MQHLLTGYLKAKGAACATALLAEMNKAESDATRKAAAMLRSVALDWLDLQPQVAAILGPLAASAAGDALNQVGAGAAVSVEQVSERAVEWARERAAEMVGMRLVNGELVQNPNAEWRIDELDRDALQDKIVTALEEGWSNDRLANEIMADSQFDADRAEMIARTETATADVQANLIAYGAANEAGIELMKRWITAGDDLVSEDCQLNADAGDIELDEPFPSGADAPPEHPNCRCDLLPVRLGFDDTEG